MRYAGEVKRSCLAVPAWSLGIMLGGISGPLSPAAAEPPPPAAAPRLLVIVIDAVPFDLVAGLSEPALGEERLFAGFKGPVPLISTFPADTNLVLPAVLHHFGLDISPGYEARFYDRRRNRTRGGGLRSYHRITFPWREFFHWQVRGLSRRAVDGLRPFEASLEAVDSALAAFRQAEDSPYFIYLAETDLLGHLYGPEAYAPVLRELDAGLRRLRAESPGQPFYTVVFSDHGMAGGEPLVNIRQAVEEGLGHAGYTTTDSLHHPRDVVLVPFGLLTSFVAHARPGQERELAASLAAVEGVDLCVAREGEGWRVESGDASALIRRRDAEGELWYYEPLVGDPLELAPVAAGLERRCPSCGGLFPDAWWLEATRDVRYPDALYRIRGSFELVENPASVVCSVVSGHVYGGEMTDLALRLTYGSLRWAHGALDRDGSLGFLVSDAPAWQPPAAARSDQALAWLEP